VASPLPDLLARTGGPARYLEELRQLGASLLPGLKNQLAKVGALKMLAEPPGAVDDFGMDAALLERLGPALDFLYQTYWRVETVDIDRIPGSGRAMVVANHGGMLPWDALVLRIALLRAHPAHRELRPLVEDFVYHMPFVGNVAVRLGAVRADPENAERLLREDKVLAVFPEGAKGIGKSWDQRYQVQRFGRGGFVKLALRTGSPIIPCAIVGSEETTPFASRAGLLAKRLFAPFSPAAPSLPNLTPMGLVPLPAKWTIRFAPPVDLAGLGPEKAADPATVQRVTEEVRATVQRMLDEQLRARA
jgi:1-acyl-sn-glycerol-3-phosphate acyltransferase